MKITWDVPSASAVSVRIGVINLAEHWTQLLFERDYTNNPNVTLEVPRGSAPNLVLTKGKEETSFEITETAYSISCMYVRYQLIGERNRRISAKAEILIYRSLPSSDRIDVLIADPPVRSVRDMESRILTDLQLLLAATSKGR